MGAKRYRDIILSSAKEFGVEPAMIFAVAEVESGFNERARSSAGAIGIMQLMPETGLWIATVLSFDHFCEEDLYRPEINIRFGAWYLSYLVSVFSEEWLVFAAYNAGEGRVRDWMKEKEFKKEDIPFSETAEYVAKAERALASFRKKKIAAI